MIGLISIRNKISCRALATRSIPHNVELSFLAIFLSFSISLDPRLTCPTENKTAADQRIRGCPITRWTSKSINMFSARRSQLQQLREFFAVLPLASYYCDQDTAAGLRRDARQSFEQQREPRASPYRVGSS